MNSMPNTDSTSAAIKPPYKIRRVKARPNEQVASAEFCQLFAAKMDGLYSLSLLLTASPEMAERCFASSLEDCLNGLAIAEQWAYFWAKRAIIKNAIRFVAPSLCRASSRTLSVSTETDPEQCGRYEKGSAIASVLALEDFERIVFVMSVLERCSDRDCAALLDCRHEQIRAARMRALQQIAMRIVSLSMYRTRPCTRALTGDGARTEAP